MGVLDQIPSGVIAQIWHWVKVIWYHFGWKKQLKLITDEFVHEIDKCNRRWAEEDGEEGTQNRYDGPDARDRTKD